MTKLRAFKKFSKQQFLTNAAIHDLAERYLHLLAECLLDVGSHIVAEQNLGSPGSYREIFQILQDHNYIDAELSAKLQDWSGYRNILVHAYLKIDHAVAYEIIKEDFKEIEEFKTIVQALI
ncbi:MAG: DUF86 domain-containing protein [bacterium]